MVEATGEMGTVRQYTDFVLPYSAQFVATPLTGTAPLTVTFTDLSTPWGWVQTWRWDFGDGSTVTEANPVHVYTAPGSFTVAPTTTVGVTSYVEFKPHYVTVTQPIPTPTPTPRPCPVRRVLAGESQREASYQALWDEVLNQSVTGRRYAALYERHEAEVTWLLAADPALAAQAAAVLRDWQPAVDGLVTAQRGAAGHTPATERVVTARDVAQAPRAVLDTLAERGSPCLRADLEPVLAELETFAGRTPADVWAQVVAAEGRVYLPLILKEQGGGHERARPDRDTDGHGISRPDRHAHRFSKAQRKPGADGHRPGRTLTAFPPPE